jgi:osmotically inducible lipoprotein OsmB
MILVLRRGRKTKEHEMLKKLAVLAIITSLALAMLAGCASPQTMNAPGNTTLGSAAVGGLSGAAIGAAVSKDHGKGALIGGAVGTVGGAMVGKTMENNRDKAMYQQQQVQGAYQQGQYDARYGTPPPPSRTY